MKMAQEKSGLGVGRCVLNLMTAYAVTVVLVMLFALVLCYSDISEEWISRGARLITLFSVALAGALCAKSGKRGGWLIGGVSGILYMIVLYALGYMIFGEIELSAASMLRVVYGLLAGIVGGIIGINMKK
ncbi:MAG: TIGR04086 family membrane protein [Oscillospiraceae bacterium]|nr:TIGR04086 family membrane protein [Oscillospiraceae bacterium]